MIRKFPFLWIVPSIYLLDRFLKVWLVSRFDEGEGFAVLPGFFHITRVDNRGAAFGILKNYGSTLLWVSALCAVVLTLYFLRDIFLSVKNRHEWLLTHRPLVKSAWSLVLAGALGNLYDRARYGVVIDYLDFRIWPVFNLSDASICVGVFLAAVGFLRGKGA